MINDPNPTWENYLWEWWLQIILLKKIICNNSLHKVQPGPRYVRTGHPLRPRHGVEDGEAHVRPAQLAEDRWVLRWWVIIQNYYGCYLINWVWNAIPWCYIVHGITWHHTHYMPCDAIIDASFLPWQRHDISYPTSHTSPVTWCHQLQPWDALLP